MDLTGSESSNKCQICLVPTRSVKNKTCSLTCRIELVARQRRKREQITCEWCKLPFEAKISLKRRFCSQSCSASNTNKIKSEQHTVHLVCPVCDTKFDIIKYYAERGQKCCSVKCGVELQNNGILATVHSSQLDKNCETCQRQYTVAWKRRDSKYCSQKCARNGIVSWNTGLTAETDDRLSHVRDVSRQTQRDRFLNGKIYQSGTGSWHESSKLIGGRVWLRSTYETKMVSLLDVDSDVICYEYEPIEIPYLADDGREHSYYPDFKIKRASGLIEIIEVKPAKLVEKRGNLLKFAAARVFCADLNWTFSVVSEDYLFGHRIFVPIT